MKVNGLLLIKKNIETKTNLQNIFKMSKMFCKSKSSIFIIFILNYTLIFTLDYTFYFIFITILFIIQLEFSHNGL